jgi:hypothetical protein
MNNYLWGKTVWWTRTGWLLGLVIMAFAWFMDQQLGEHLGACGLPSGLTNPGLAIELAVDWRAVMTIAGPCQSTTCQQSMSQQVCHDASCQLVCADKVDALLQQQSLDRIFIFLYASLFIYFGALNLLFGGLRLESENRPLAWLRRLVWPLSRTLCIFGGLAAIGFTVLGAWNDWLEDDRIVEALTTLANSAASMPAIRDAAYHKWLFLFIAIGCLSPLFISWPCQVTRRAASDPQPPGSALLQLLAWITGLEAITATFGGVAACRFGQDQRIESAAGTLFIALPLAILVMMAARFWIVGTMSALNRIAGVWFIRWLVKMRPEEERVSRPAQPS